VYDVTSLDLCLADFEFTCSLDEDHSILFQKCGTPGFIAPEILKGFDHASIKSDVFGIGATLFYLMSNGKPLYESLNVEQLVNLNENMDV
jgi:calcium/calmodulin-dependent protein kinase I